MQTASQALGFERLLKRADDIRFQKTPARKQCLPPSDTYVGKFRMHKFWDWNVALQ